MEAHIWMLFSHLKSEQDFQQKVRMKKRCWRFEERRKYEAVIWESGRINRLARS